MQQPLILTAALWLLAVAANGADEPRAVATYDMANDTIAVILNDIRYPLDDFDFPANTTHINNLYIGFHDGLTGYYFNDFVQGGNSSLVLIGGVVQAGSAPDQSIAMTFADADPPARFTIELLVEMLGNGSHGLRSTAIITNLLDGSSLENTKFYVFSDIAITASESGDITAYDASSGIFYAYDDTNSPNTWFGCHGNGDYPFYYAGLPYEGPPGLAPFHAAIVAGNNLTNVVDSTPEDQVAGWNWDTGTITNSATVGFAVAAHDSLNNLVVALESSVPESAVVVFVDGFESGDTTAWDG